MDSIQFQQIFNKQMDTCQSMLFRKATEYATDDERLHNFKVAATLLSKSPVQALGGMMVKHTTSIYDMIEAGNPGQFSTEVWDEKITDHINYLILLKAAVVEESEGLPNAQPKSPAPLTIS